MSDKKKNKFLNKVIRFAGKDVTVYSLDGVTWSTRRNELVELQERLERERVSFAALKEGDGAAVAEGTAPIVAAEDHKDEDDLPIDDDQPPRVAGPGRPAKGKFMKGAAQRSAPAAKPVAANEPNKGRGREKHPTIAPALARKGSEIAAKKAKGAAKVSPKKHAVAAKPVKSTKSKGSAKKRKAA